MDPFTKRLLFGSLVSTILIALLAAPATCSAVGIEIIVSENDGQIYLKNPTEEFIFIDGYSIDSGSSALNASQWISVTNFYDLSAGGFLDSNADWFFLSQTDQSIAEASPVELSGSIMPGQIVSLGAVWRVGQAQDLTGTVTAADVVTDVDVDFRSFVGDYNFDLVVDQNDFDVWSSSFGATDDLRADGNFNGIIDAADYTIWRDALAGNTATGEQFLPAPFTPALATASTPEPSALLLLLGGSGLCLASARRVR